MAAVSAGWELSPTKDEKAITPSVWELGDVDHVEGGNRHVVLRLDPDIDDGHRRRGRAHQRRPDGIGEELLLVLA